MNRGESFLSGRLKPISDLLCSLSLSFFLSAGSRKEPFSDTDASRSRASIILLRVYLQGGKREERRERERER